MSDPGPPSSPSPPKRRLAAAARRELIEGAAARVFARDGYEGARLEDIAAAADVTKPMLYRHFGSKKELYLSLLSHHRDALAIAALTPFLQTEGTLRVRVEAMLDGWFAYVEAHPAVAPLLFGNTSADPDVRRMLAELHERQRAVDAALFREAGADIAPELEGPLAEVVRSSLGGLAVWWGANPDVPRPVLVASMLRVLEGIAPGEWSDAT